MGEAVQRQTRFARIDGEAEEVDVGEGRLRAVANPLPALQEEVERLQPGFAFAAIMVDDFGGIFDEAELGCVGL